MAAFLPLSQLGPGLDLSQLLPGPLPGQSPAPAVCAGAHWRLPCCFLAAPVLRPIARTETCWGHRPHNIPMKGKGTSARCCGPCPRSTVRSEDENGFTAICRVTLLQVFLPHRGTLGLALWGQGTAGSVPLQTLARRALCV